MMKRKVAAPKKNPRSTSKKDGQPSTRNQLSSSTSTNSQLTTDSSANINSQLTTDSSSISNLNVSNSRKKKQMVPKRKIPQSVVLMQGIKHIVNTKILKDIAKLQQRTDFLIPRIAFARVVKELMTELSGDDLKIQSMALQALQTSAEMYLSAHFEDSYMCALHGKRVTLHPKDMQLALKIRKDD